MSQGTKDSFDHLRRKIRELGKGGPRILGPGLKQIGEEVMTDVKASREGRGVPRDRGHLADSGKVEGPEDMVVTLAFGDTSAPYALYQHEILDLNHRVGEARYLVRGVERWRPNGSSVNRALAEQAAEVARLASRVP